MKLDIGALVREAGFSRADDVRSQTIKTSTPVFLAANKEIEALARLIVEQ